jgi:acyl-CoA reductase-like NAD-dependent aldehyde dehydrogenase
MYTQVKDYAMYIAGGWTTGDSKATLEATGPATGEVIGTVPEGTREDVRRAIDAAGEAWPVWAALGVRTRRRHGEDRRYR